MTATVIGLTLATLGFPSSMVPATALAAGTPTANAGANQTVASGAAVQLDGSASTDPNGLPLTYQWTQTSGTAVTLWNTISPTQFGTGTAEGGVGASGDHTTFMASDGTMVAVWYDGSYTNFSYAPRPYTTWKTIQVVRSDNHAIITGFMNSSDDSVEFITGTSPSGFASYYKASKSGASYTLSAPTTVESTNQAAQYLPHQGTLAKDKQGRYWLVYLDATGVTGHAYYTTTPTTPNWTEAWPSNGAPIVQATKIYAAVVGNYLVVGYTSSSANQEVYQRLDVSGTTLGSWSAVKPIGNNETPAGAYRSFTSNGNIGFWSSFDVYNGNGFLALQYSIYNPTTDSFSAFSRLSENANDEHPNVVTDENGDFYILYSKTASTSTSVTGTAGNAIVFKKYTVSSGTLSGYTTLVAAGGTDYRLIPNGFVRGNSLVYVYEDTPNTTNGPFNYLAGSVQWGSAAATAAKPTFTAPTGPATLGFQLVVSDGQATSAPASTTVTVSAPPDPTAQCPCSVFATTATPTTASVSDTGAYELGMKFQVSASGYITGVRFYKGAQNTGTHTGSLWDGSGKRLGTVTFTGETASGWQSANFGSSVQVSANTTYIISYHTDSGHFAVDRPYFTSGNAAAFSGGVVSALADGGTAGANGIYAPGPSAFPTQSYNASNYWVDAVFSKTALPSTPTANAGANQTVSSGATAQLDGSASTDPNGLPLTYQWTQTSGTAVTLSSATAAKPTFTAPAGPATLGFQLVVSDGQATSTPASTTVTVAAAQTCPCGVFATTATPTTASVSDAGAYELGMKFQTTSSGYVTGVRFYKGAQNTGTHTGSLWDAAGHVLATVTFSNETASGWQSANFGQPVQISANTTYVVSYHTDSGHFAVDRPYFTSGNAAAFSGGIVSAATDGGTAGANGVYTPGPSAFPTNSYNASNYWVDTLFVTTLPPDTTSPTVLSVAPSNGTTGVGLSPTVAATMSKAINPQSVTTSTVQLLDGSGVAVASAVGYAGGTHTITLVPSVTLLPNTTYTTVIHGGSGGVTDLSGNALAADYRWSFTTLTCPCSVWGQQATPTTASVADTNAYELGMKFQVSVAGHVTGVAFYKGSLNTGTHTGSLWDSTGHLLATVTFSNETATGWQTANFATPVAVSPGTVYVISYHTNTGGYALDRPYFTSTNAKAYSGGVVSAVTDGGSAGGNGVYAVGASTFPTNSYNAGNYWVDVLFTSN